MLLTDDEIRRRLADGATGEWLRFLSAQHTEHAAFHSLAMAFRLGFAAGADEGEDQDDDAAAADPTAAHWWDRAELINWMAEHGALTPVRFRHTCDDYIAARTLTEALSAAAQHQCPDAGKGQVTSITYERLTGRDRGE